MAFVCDLKSDQEPPKPEIDEDLEDGEIEDDDEDMPPSEPAALGYEGLPPLTVTVVNPAPAVVPEVQHVHKEKSEKSKDKEARKERKSSRHDKKHMTEAEKSVLYLHKMERLEREKRDKYRREQGHPRRRGGSISPTPLADTPNTTNADHSPSTIDEAADEDFATSLQRVLQSVLKKDKSAQAQAAVAGVNQQQAGAASNQTIATAISDEGGGERRDDAGVGDEEGGGSAEEISSKRLARRRKRERKKAVKELDVRQARQTAAKNRQETPEYNPQTPEETIEIDFTADVDVECKKGFVTNTVPTGVLVEELWDMECSAGCERKRAARKRIRDRKKAQKRARLEAAFTAAFTNDGTQDVNDSNESANLNGGSPSNANNNKMDAGDDNMLPSDNSSSDDEHGRHDRRNRGDRRCNRKMKRRYRSVEREAGGATPTKVKKGDTKLGLCLSYIQGKCMNRDCPYSHEYSPHMKMELCKFYLMECCAKGDKCYYLHKEFPCKYYHTGLPCIDADKCKFNHGKPLSDSFKSILCKHIETAPKEILGDFPRFNREDATNMIAITQKKLEEKYSKKDENKDNDKDDKRDPKRNRPSRWQDPPLDKSDSKGGSVVNLGFLHDKDQDMRFASNGDIDMRTLPPSSPSTSIPLSTTINTSTPPPNLLNLHKQPSPTLPKSSNSTAAQQLQSNASADPSAATTLLQQLRVSNPAAAALLLAGAQSGVAGAAAVAAILQSVGRSQQVQLLAGAPIVAGAANSDDEDSHEAVIANQQQSSLAQLPVTMQIPPPQLNPNAILFSTPPPSLLSTPPPNIIKNQQRHHNNRTLIKQPKAPPPPIVTNTPPALTTVVDLKMDIVHDVDKSMIVKDKKMRRDEIKMESNNDVLVTGQDDTEMLDIERYKREAGIGLLKINDEKKQEDVKMEVNEELEETDEEERSLQIDCPPLDEPISKPSTLDSTSKAELPHLPRAQMDLFLRIQSQQAKSSTIQTPTPNNTDSQMDESTTSPTAATKDSDTAAASQDNDPTSTIDWYSDDEDSDDDNKLTIGEDADPYDDIITKNVDVVPPRITVSKKAEVVVEKEKETIELQLPPMVEIVPRAEQIVEKLGDLSKIDISAEVTKLLTSISGGKKAADCVGEEKGSTSSDKSLSSSYTAPSDPRTCSSGSKSPRSDPRTSSDPRISSTSSDPRTHSRHRHHNRSSDTSSSSPSHQSNMSASASSSGGRSDPRRRRSSAESSDGGRSSGSERGRVPVPSIYDQATASFRMSNKDLDLRLGGSVIGEEGREGGAVAKLADVDLRSVSQGGRPDIDLRASMPQQLALPLQFKAAMAAYTPATEIDATFSATYIWRIYEVDVPRPDYSGLRLTEAEARSTGDPRLEKIFRLASGEIKPDENKEKTEFTIDESPASPVRDQPVAKPPTPRADPRRRKPVEEPPSCSPSDPTQLTYAQQLALLQTSAFYQNLTSNQKLNLNHELSLRTQQPLHPHQHPPGGGVGANTDPVMAAVLHSLGLTGGNIGLAQQQHQQQQMMMQLQQFGALGLIQQMQQQQQGGGGGGGGGPVIGRGRMGGIPNNQQGLLGAAPGVPHEFNHPPQGFHNAPPNINSNMHNPNNNFNNNSPNYNSPNNNDQYDQYDDDQQDNNYNNHCFNNNQPPNNNNMNMMMSARNNHRGGGGGGGNFRDNRNNNRRGGIQQGQNRHFGNNRNNRNNFRRNRNNNGRGGIVD